MSRTKLAQSKRASLEKQLMEIEKNLVVGVKDAVSMLFTLDAIHEIMDYCEELAAKWEDKPLDFTDDDLDSFDLDDDENEEE